MKIFPAMIIFAVCLATVSCSCGAVDDYGETCREEEEQKAAENRERDLDNRICYNQTMVNECIKEQESLASPEGTDYKSYCQEKYSYKCKE